eukprot:Lithocolla_globosa_v1_NODE_537_length_3794_cov_22.651976.p1 type:complete len:488 gc:universal NODE_537_length_3794_cov_22.651976:1347-2810(+)
MFRISLQASTRRGLFVRSFSKQVGVFNNDKVKLTKSIKTGEVQRAVKSFNDSMMQVAFSFGWVSHVALFCCGTFTAVLVAGYIAKAREIHEFIDEFDVIMTVLTDDVLKKMARLTAENDTLARRIFQDPKTVDIMFQIIEKAQRDRRNAAANILEACLRLPENQAFAMDQGYHQTILRLARETKSIYVRKCLAGGLVHIIKNPMVLPDLIDTGVLRFLDDILSDPLTKREYIQYPVQKVSLAFLNSYNNNNDDNTNNNNNEIVYDHKKYSLQPEDLNILKKYSSQLQELNKSPIFQTKNLLVEQGLFLYLHTATGGAVWGAIESYRKNYTLPNILKFTMRNALVTSLLPIYFVGGLVTTFMHFKKQCDTIDQTWRFYSVALMGLYPFFYLIPIVELWSPYWLGGHILGFGSFYSYLIYSDSDLMKSDHKLHLEEMSREAPTQQSKTRTLEAVENVRLKKVEISLKQLELAEKQLEMELQELELEKNK